MTVLPSHDPVGALVPHTLEEPLAGAASGPLAGLTFMAKDLFAIEGRKVGNGNPSFYEHASPAKATAPVIERLLAAGAACTGITICDEFFYSVLGSNAHYGQPVNMRAPEHVTGGSSCGSAAAVAASLCDFALGSDTGGSIRVPASFCGLFGLRPSHGRIDLGGATAMAPSFDTVGYLARDAETFRAVGQVLLEDDPVDAAVTRVIVAEDLFAYSDTNVRDALQPVLDQLEMGLIALEHRDIAGRDIAAWRDAFRIIQGFEIQSTLLPFIEAHADVDLGPGIKERFASAAAITRTEAEAARTLRGEISRRLHDLVQPGTVMVFPTTPTLPPQSGVPDGDAFVEFRTLTLQSTCLAGHAGLPQMSIPAVTAGGIPVGLSAIGWQGGDEALLDLAVQLEPFLEA